MKTRIALVVALAVVVTACVSKGKYKALQKQLEQANATVVERDDKVKSLEEVIAEEQEKVKGLESNISRLEANIIGFEDKVKIKDSEIARLNDEQRRLEGELANVVKDRARLKSSAAELKRALAELSKRKAEAEARLAQFRNLLARFKSLIDAGKLRVKIVDGRMVLELPTDVLFESGRAKLSDAGTAAITEVGAILATFTDRRFQIEGHTDNVPIKTSRFPSNWDLAAARSLTVVKTLQEAGMSGTLLSAASFAEFRPVTSNATDEGKSANRRIEIVIVPDLSSLPGFDELNSAMKGS